MKRRFIPFALTLALLLGLGALLAGQGPDDAKFTKLVDTYLESYWKFYPTAATLAGFYKFNDKLEDFSESVVDKRGPEIEGFNKELTTKISVDKLNPDFQIDRQLLLETLDLDLLRLADDIRTPLVPVFFLEPAQLFLNKALDFFLGGEYRAAQFYLL